MGLSQDDIQIGSYFVLPRTYNAESLHNDAFHKNLSGFANHTYPDLDFQIKSTPHNYIKVA